MIIQIATFRKPTICLKKSQVVLFIFISWQSKNECTLSKIHFEQSSINNSREKILQPSPICFILISTQEKYKCIAYVFNVNNWKKFNLSYFCSFYVSDAAELTIPTNLYNKNVNAFVAPHVFPKIDSKKIITYSFAFTNSVAECISQSDDRNFSTSVYAI